MNKLPAPTLLLLASIALGAPEQALATVVEGGAASCAANSRTFNPMTDTDWNNLYPIVIAGAPMGPIYPQSPLHFVPPVCVCPGKTFGITSPGIGITYWEPMYVSEVERTAGCLSSLGGTSVLESFSSLSSEQRSRANQSSDAVSRMQIHWYEYPVFAMIDMFLSSGCNSPSGFALGYLTEVDPTWQNDAWGVVFSPEASLFSSPAAQASCAIDAVAAGAGFPLDAMFWCAGTWGATYPLTGNAQHSNSAFTMNNLIQAKFIARQHRLGMLWQTIGPTAICTSHPNPVWMKGQYRVDQVGFIPRYGMPVPIGNPGLLQFPTISNAPSQESTVNLIWQGKQCCATFW